ncbi:sulfite exporter TauE/SafE family protein [Trinickia terrae]|uniref:Probable membrane transporter protein n=1 Tax=Trinickia terrae TaxID=2571161 RepID=A0A4U1HT28_9BURK|nr:sulfite exporter TauE/SafE family protein [Trinickia terrae]TKC83583.1 sulfite exporter TauE/SafE family protein [Trinickia terrae]
MSIALSWLHTQIALAGVSGLSIGFALGLVGGGAGMLAVPLLLYFVKVGDPHMAIGTTAISIAMTALVNLVAYARAGLVRWRTASVFAAAGVAGAFAGSRWSLHVDGGVVMLLLAAVVAVVGVMMFSRSRAAAPRLSAAGDARQEPEWAGRGIATAGAGVAIGGVAGFFGVSGGFLSVPALHFIARIPMLEAVASSLLSVIVFGATTGVNYAIAGKVSVPLSLALVAGGVVGGNAGMRAAKTLANKGDTLRQLFAAMLLLIAAYIAYRSVTQS